jgi:hypothetical protein
VEQRVARSNREWGATAGDGPVSLRSVGLGVEDATAALEALTAPGTR